HAPRIVATLAVDVHPGRDEEACARSTAELAHDVEIVGERGQHGFAGTSRIGHVCSRTWMGAPPSMLCANDAAVSIPSYAELRAEVRSAGGRSDQGAGTV